MKRVQISMYEMNFLKDDGTYLLNNHVKYCYTFNDGFLLVKYNNDTYNFVNEEGKKLLKNNVNDSSYFNNGYAYVQINNIEYYIDKECNFYKVDKKVSLDTVSFKILYKLYPQKRQELINIIKEYTYHNIEEYF